MGILLLASWPNAAFDLCGICCGAFKMPFWEFFGATLIGKGGVKVNGQVCVREVRGSEGVWGVCCDVHVCCTAVERAHVGLLLLLRPKQHTPNKQNQKN